MTIRIAQISDLHFGRDTPRVAESLLNQLTADRPTMVAVCGDLTQRAREREFRAARDFLNRLPAPALVVPGNHDLPGWRLWSRFLRPWRRWQRHIIETSPSAVTPFATDGLVAVGVNTARRWGPYPDWSRGRINAKQVASALAELDHAAPGALRVIVAHHPFLVTPSERARGLVGGSTAALRLLSYHADVLLGGHLHVAYSGVVSGLVVAQSGTAVSDRLKGEPNSYNLIEADGNELGVTTLSDDGTGFHVRQRSQFIRDGDRWRQLS